jgi:hypothetical protein
LAGVAISLFLLGVGAVLFGAATIKTTDRPPDPTTGCVWFLGARSRHSGRRRGGRRVRDGAHPGTKPAAQRHQPAGFFAADLLDALVVAAQAAGPGDVELGEVRGGDVAQLCVEAGDVRVGRRSPR